MADVQIWLVGLDDGDDRFSTAFASQLNQQGWASSKYAITRFPPTEPSDPDTSGTNDTPYATIKEQLDAARARLGIPTIFVVVDTRALIPVREWVEANAPGTPIVAAVSHNPDLHTIADTLIRPDRAITGVVIKSGPLVRRRLELLRDATGRKQLVVLHMPHQSSVTEVEFPEVQTIAPVVGFPNPEILTVTTIGEVKPKLDGLTAKGSKALYMVSHPVLTYNLAKVAGAAVANKLPGVFPSRYYVEKDGFMSCGVDPIWMVQRAAIYVQQIVDGKLNPNTTPMQGPSVPQVAFHPDPVTKYDIQIPPDVLAQANPGT